MRWSYITLKEQILKKYIRKSMFPIADGFHNEAGPLNHFNNITESV